MERGGGEREGGEGREKKRERERKRETHALLERIHKGNDP